MSKSGDTYRTTCCRGRVSYNDKFYGQKPWGAFVDGVAVIAFSTLDEARAWFKKKGMHLSV